MKEFENVGAGWQPLLEELHKSLLELDPNYQVIQIKEKFGGLRYYIAWPEGCDDNETIQKMEVLIAIAEAKSYTICETCGKLGKLRIEQRWLTTACDEHRRYQ